MHAAANELHGVAIDADAIARAIAFTIEQPGEVDVNEMIIRPTKQELWPPVTVHPTGGRHEQYESGSARDTRSQAGKGGRGREIPPERPASGGG